MAEAVPVQLSVVIPSVNGWADLEGVLDALAAQQGGVRLEVIVVDRTGEAVRAAVRTRYPYVRLVEAPAGTTIPTMRKIGFDVAAAPVVGVIEDHVLVPCDWAVNMLEAHAAGALAVGGSVANAALDRLVDRAAFLCEYSHCLTPPEGEAEWLTGNNVTYRRELLERFRDTIAEGRWEDHLHQAFRSAGVGLLSVPAIRVLHKKHYTVGEYTYQRYVYARAYAAMRVEGAPLARRLGIGAAAFALPALLGYRILARTLAGPTPATEVLRATPLLLLFVSAWAAGEVVGYWRGPGNALAEVC